MERQNVHYRDIDHTPRYRPDGKSVIKLANVQLPTEEISGINRKGHVVIKTRELPLAVTVYTANQGSFAVRIKRIETPVRQPRNRVGIATCISGPMQSQTISLGGGTAVTLEKS